MNAGPENADDAAVVLFDGVCVLCARSVRFIARRVPAVRFRFAAHGSPDVVRLADQLERLTEINATLRAELVDLRRLRSAAKRALGA